MRTFSDYYEEWRLVTGDEPLEMVPSSRGFILTGSDGPVMTPGGHEFAVEGERVARLVLCALMFRPGMREDRPGAPVFQAFRIDVFDHLGDPFAGRLEALMDEDPVVAVKSEGSFRFRSREPEDPLFAFSFITLAGLVRSVNAFVQQSARELILPDDAVHPFREMLRLSYEQLQPERKVALQALSGMHRSGVVLPMLVVTGEITPGEYGRCMVALGTCEPGSFEGFYADASSAAEFIRSHDDRADAAGLADRLAREGESDSVEYKSTLRWDLRAGKTNPAVERASLKTIAAFLNSSGGFLVIGLRDDGSVEGIESDRFANDDKFLLHLWTLIRTSMGRDVSPYVRTLLEKHGDKTVCVVQCLRSLRPVFLRQPGFDEEFFIRVGPSSNALDISEALVYIADRFGE